MHRMHKPNTIKGITQLKSMPNLTIPSIKQYNLDLSITNRESLENQQIISDGGGIAISPRPETPKFKHNFNFLKNLRHLSNNNNITSMIPYQLNDNNDCDNLIITSNRKVNINYDTIDSNKPK